MNVSRINIAPVKGLGLQHPDSVELGPGGVVENRRYYLLRGERMFNGKDFGPLVRIRPEAANGSLALHFPDGSVVAGEVALGGRVATDFWGYRDVPGHVVEGPWAAALSEYAGEELRLVLADETDSGVDVHPGTLVSRASGERLAEVADAEVDLRRFRMLFELDGADAHAEDEWQGRELRIGGAVVRAGGPVPRCVVTTHDPDTGVRSLDTLRLIKSYRGTREGTKIDFGVYFDVVQPGRIVAGAAVTLL